jgi:hypothetical protein
MRPCILVSRCHHFASTHSLNLETLTLPKKALVASRLSNKHLIERASGHRILEILNYKGISGTKVTATLIQKTVLWLRCVNGTWLANGTSQTTT